MQQGLAVNDQSIIPATSRPGLRHALQGILQLLTNPAVRQGVRLLSLTSILQGQNLRHVGTDNVLRHVVAQQAAGEAYVDGGLLHAAQHNLVTALALSIWLQSAKVCPLKDCFVSHCLR